jgi:Ca2+/Na+ antiporter
VSTEEHADSTRREAMKTISSKQTFFVKKVLPVLLLVATLVMIWSLAGGRLSALRTSPTVLLCSFVMLVIFFSFWRVRNLADEVSDGGDFLLVRRGSVEERVQLSDIMNVSYDQSNKMPRLTLRLRKPGKFGDEIVFCPRHSIWIPSARNAIADDLILRVERARSGNR